MTITTTPTTELVDHDRPYRIGFGPPVFSTCTTLVSVARICWDVNGYYRALGVRPEATRKELREGYQRQGGQDSPYLTYVLSQLLDADTRAVYDLRPLGPPMSDRYVVEQFRRKIREDASEETLEQISEIEKFIMSLPDDKFQASLDDSSVDVQDGEASPDTGFPYSHYLYRSTAGQTEHLPHWQSLLIQACRDRGIEVSIALGFHRVALIPWLVQQVGYHTVVFLHEDRLPDAVYAEDAANYIALLQRTTAA